MDIIIPPPPTTAPPVISSSTEYTNGSTTYFPSFNGDDPYPDWVTWATLGLALVEAIICGLYNHYVSKCIRSETAARALLVLGLVFWCFSGLTLLIFVTLVEKDTALRPSLFILCFFHMGFFAYSYTFVKNGAFSSNSRWRRRSSASDAGTASTNRSTRRDLDEPPTYPAVVSGTFPEPVPPPTYPAAVEEPPQYEVGGFVIPSAPPQDVEQPPSYIPNEEPSPYEPPSYQEAVVAKEEEEMRY